MSYKTSFRPIYVLALLTLAACSSDKTGPSEGAAPTPAVPVMSEGAPGPDGPVVVSPAPPYTAAPGQTPGVAPHNGPGQASAVTTTTSLVPNAQVTGAPLFVIISGNDSCKSQMSMSGMTPEREAMYPRLMTMLTEVQEATGVAVNYLMACYVQGTSEMFVFHSAIPEQTQKIHESQLSNLISSFAPSVLFLAGHSYGGWQAMNVAQDLAPQRRINGLFTIDAISANLCKKVGDVDCQKFPRDFTENDLYFISQQTNVWANFFQRVTPLLRSGTTPFAQESRNILASHWQIDVSKKVWNDITGYVIANLQPQQP